MKKIIASAVGLAMIGGVAVTTASAVENKFGGYWRTRIFSQSNFDGQSSDYWRADNRTRLYYTAKFNDDFKFVNKFEFNTVWGDNNGGDVGADGTSIWRIKNSYADFTLGNINTKLGIHSGTIARGFIFDDDFSGATVTAKFGNVTVPLIWVRAVGEYAQADRPEDNDVFAAIASIKLGDMGSVAPYVVYQNGAEELDAYWLGVDADLNFGAASAWGSLIFNGGTNGAGDDNKGFLVAAGGSVSVVHGQVFYSTGDDNAADGDNDEFKGIAGQVYYWAEIMGWGTFDNRLSNGLGSEISNMLAANVGVTIKPMDKLTLKADVWYASLAEDNLAGDKDLGTEVDLKVTYAVMDNLNLDVVGAYLFAGDVTGTEDPVEVGARLSLKF